MNILVTGGAGYIGSHACVELLQAGHEIVILDNLSNSSAISIERVQEITGKPLSFVKGDIRDFELINNLLVSHCVDAVIHFAGLKAVGESVTSPLSYYDCNVSGTITLLKSMKESNVKTLIFSSSATVYGDTDILPINETARLCSTSPYGETKKIVEHILADLQISDPSWRIASLRYFNPVGAHPSGLIGEAPTGTPNNLMPYISQVAGGKRDQISVFGNDYPTRDGTGIRDYIHVVDLVQGHIAALRYLAEQPQGEFFSANLGRGEGYTVLEVIDSFEKISGKHIKTNFTTRRAGDVASCYADVKLAANKLNWEAKLGLDDMCKDMWNWQNKNPNGYDY